MSSGTKVSEKVKETFTKMKLNLSDTNAMDRIRLVTLVVTDTDISVEQEITEKDLVGKNVYDYFCSLMKENDCKYILYDCHYETKETKKEHLIFVMWAHEKAPIKLRMKYASSKLYLKKVVDAKHEFEMHELEEHNINSFAERLGKNILSIENQNLRGSS